MTKEEQCWCIGQAEPLPGGPPISGGPDRVSRHRHDLDRSLDEAQGISKPIGGEATVHDDAVGGSIEPAVAGRVPCLWLVRQHVVRGVDHRQTRSAQLAQGQSVEPWPQAPLEVQDVGLLSPRRSGECGPLERIAKAAQDAPGPAKAC